jgi:hypothetical protein
VDGESVTDIIHYSLFTIISFRLTSTKIKTKEESTAGSAKSAGEISFQLL